VDNEVVFTGTYALPEAVPLSFYVGDGRNLPFRIATGVRGGDVGWFYPAGVTTTAR
jgi:hypothetical protein